MDLIWAVHDGLNMDCIRWVYYGVLTLGLVCTADDGLSIDCARWAWYGLRTMGLVWTADDWLGVDCGRWATDFKNNWGLASILFHYKASVMDEAKVRARCWYELLARVQSIAKKFMMLYITTGKFLKISEDFVCWFALKIPIWKEK